MDAAPKGSARRLSRATFNLFRLAFTLAKAYTSNLRVNVFDHITELWLETSFYTALKYCCASSSSGCSSSVLSSCVSSAIPPPLQDTLVISSPSLALPASTISAGMVELLLTPKV